MTQTWKAIPLDEDRPEGPSLKAPSMAEFRRQTGDNWRLPKALESELPAAEAMLEAIDDGGFRIPLGAKFTCWRYPQGLAVQMPSGWTLYIPMDSQTLKGHRERPAESPEEEPSFKPSTGKGKR